MTALGRPIGPVALLLKSIGMINLSRAVCGPPVDPETFFGTSRVRLALHICHDHCPIRDDCEVKATQWHRDGGFSEPTIMGGRIWGAGHRKNFYTISGTGICPICDADHSASLHLGPPTPRRKRRATNDTTPPDQRATDQEPGGLG